MAESKTVQVGESTYTIAPFKGFKAVRIGRIVATITNRVPEVLTDMAAFTRQYEAENVVRITRAMSALPRFQGLFAQWDMSDEDWERAGGAVEIPQAPDNGMVIAAVFPKVFAYAEDNVLELLAWIAAPNAELRKADEEDNVDAYISKLKKDLLHEGDLDELMNLAVTGSELVREQFAGKVEQLGNAISALTGRQGASPSQPTPVDEPVSEPEPDGTSPNLSTASPTPTDGADETPSTESPSAS